MAEIGSAWLRVMPDTDGLNARMAAYFRSSDWGKLGKAAGVALGAGLAAGGVAKGLYEVGQAFDDVSDKIRVRTGETGKHLDRLEGVFERVVRDVPVDFDTASTAVADLNRRLDLTGKPLERRAKQFAEFSRITGTDLSSSIQHVTRLFGDWSVQTGRQGRTLDGLYRLSQETGVEVDVLAAKLVQFGSPLRQLGFDLDTSAAMFARFEREGVNAQTLMPGFKQAVSNMARPTEDLVTEFDRLGISLDDGFQPALEGVFASLERMKDEQKAAALAADVFGTRAGPDMAAAIREGRFELDELMQTFRSGDDTIRKSARETEDFAEHWQRFKNNVLLALEPVAEDVFKAVGDAMEDVTDIIADPRLTNAQKFERLRDLAVDALGDIVGEAGRIAPEVVQALGEGIIQGWRDMSPLAKLFTVGALFTAIGGKGALLRAGAAVGAPLATGIGMGVRRRIGPATIGAGLVIGDLILSEASRRMAENSGDIFEALEAKTANRQILGFDVDFSGEESALNKLFGVNLLGLNESEVAAKDLSEAMQEIQASGRQITTEEVDELRSTLAKVDGVSDEARRSFNEFVAAASKGADKLDQLHIARIAARDFDQGWNRSLRKAAGITDREMDQIEHLLTVHPERGIDALQDAMRRGVESIRRAMEQGEVSTRRGSMAIHTLLNRELQAYGMSHGDAEKILRAKQHPEDARGLMHGGLAAIVPGTAPGDRHTLAVDGVPIAKIESREGVFVGNRTLMEQAAAANAAIPRRAKGGPVLVPKGGFPDAQGALPGLDALAYVLKKKFGLGVSPGGGLRPGAITTSGNISDHSWGGAIDVSNGVTTPEMDAAYAWLNRTISPAIKQILYRTMIGGNHYDHIHVALLEQYANSAAAVMRLIGGVGGIGAGGFGELNLPRFIAKYKAFTPHAAGLNQLSAGLERQLGSRLDSATGFGAGGTHGAEGVGKAALARAWRGAGGPDDQANIAAAVAMAESGGQIAARNVNTDGSVDLGAWQINSVHGFPESQLLTLAGNASAAVKVWRDAGGFSPWVQFNSGAYRDFLKHGGFVDLWGKGMASLPPWGGSFADGGTVPGPIGAPRTVIAHGGERIGREPREFTMRIIDWQRGIGKVRAIYADEASGDRRHDRQMDRISA